MAAKLNEALTHTTLTIMSASAARRVATTAFSGPASATAAARRRLPAHLQVGHEIGSNVKARLCYTLRLYSIHGADSISQRRLAGAAGGWWRRRGARSCQRF